MVARRAHNPKAAGSSPAPATSEKTGLVMVRFFRFYKFDARFKMKEKRKSRQREAMFGLTTETFTLKVHPFNERSRPINKAVGRIVLIF